MKGYLVVAGLVLGLLLCSVPGISLAQEVEELEYSWGKVSSVSSEQIVVTEYDYDADKEVDVTYTLDPEVELKNVESLEDIKVGDSVEIDYVVKDGKRVAKIITTVEEPSEEEPTPSETYEEEPEYSPEEVEY